MANEEKRDAVLILNFPFSRLPPEVNPKDPNIIFELLGKFLLEHSVGLQGAEVYPSHQTVVMGFVDNYYSQTTLLYINANSEQFYGVRLRASIIPYKSINYRPLPLCTTVVIDEPNLVWAKCNLPLMSGFTAATLIKSRAPIFVSQLTGVPNTFYEEELRIEFENPILANAAMKAIASCTHFRPRLI